MENSPDDVVAASNGNSSTIDANETTPHSAMSHDSAAPSTMATRVMLMDMVVMMMKKTTMRTTATTMTQLNWCIECWLNGGNVHVKNKFRTVMSIYHVEMPDSVNKFEVKLHNMQQHAMQSIS